VAPRTAGGEVKKERAWLQSGGDPACLFAQLAADAILAGRSSPGYSAAANPAAGHTPPPALAILDR